MAHDESTHPVKQTTNTTVAVLMSAWYELRAHAPFTLGGALAGIVVLTIMAQFAVPHDVSEWLFEVMHPAHVLLSAIATTAIFRLHGKHGVVSTVLVGYIGAVGIGTLSDCLIPYWGEMLLDMEHAHAHIGFIEEWYIVNPLALIGVAIAMRWPKTKFSHAGHVLLSTWASLFHMTMAAGGHVDAATVVLVPAFLFIAVWVPCCASDIVFPMLLSGGHCDIHHCHHGGEKANHDHGDHHDHGPADTA